ncbi:hypothetical protein JS562_53770 [Agrobacterium sp. S2]|nr:hypothetical protein [Agrobacterium sp. S2]
MVKVSYPACGEQITACHECLDWSCYVDIIDGEVMVFEWHRFDCALLPFIRLGTCHGHLGPDEYCPECGTYNPNES